MRSLDRSKMVDFPNSRHLERHNNPNFRNPSTPKNPLSSK